VRVVVLEGSPQLGGKLSVAEVAGAGVDVGAEALLARRPEGTGLIQAAGLGGELVSPGTTAARIWSRGEMHRLPARQFMGVPADTGELGQTGLLSAEGLARASREPELPATHRDGDVPVASFVAARFGPEIVDRLVDPLLGGVYAGRSEELSFEATLPGLAQASRTHPSLAGAAASLLFSFDSPLRRHGFVEITGTEATVAAALRCAMYRPSCGTELIRNIGIVDALVTVRLSARNSSFQAKMMQISAVDTRPGETTGMITSVISRNRPAPSSRAASSISVGTSSMNERIIQIASGRFIAA